LPPLLRKRGVDFSVVLLIRTRKQLMEMWNKEAEPAELQEILLGENIKVLLAKFLLFT
jgi:hypothetical protein